MIDVLRKKNKYGQSALTQVLGGGYGQTISTRTQKAKAGASQENYILTLPLLGVNLKLDYTHSVGLSPDQKRIIWQECYNGEVALGKKKIIIDHAEESDKEIKNGFDLDKFVFAVTAYGYVIKNINDVLLEGKTKEELNRMSIEELEKIVIRKDEIINSFKEAMLKTSIQEECEIDSQKMIDELFGDGKVSLDEIISQNVDNELSLREREMESNARQQIDEEKMREIEVIKEGFAKLLAPVKMTFEKVVDYFKNKHLARIKRDSLRAEKHRRDELIDELSV